MAELVKVSWGLSVLCALPMKESASSATSINPSGTVADLAACDLAACEMRSWQYMTGTATVILGITIFMVIASPQGILL